MTQKAHAGASHFPRASPGSGRVTISVAVGAGEPSALEGTPMGPSVSACGDGVVRTEGGLGCVIPTAAVYTHGARLATLAEMSRTESAFDRPAAVVRTALA